MLHIFTSLLARSRPVSRVLELMPRLHDISGIQGQDTGYDTRLASNKSLGFDIMTNALSMSPILNLGIVMASNHFTAGPE